MILPRVLVAVALSATVAFAQRGDPEQLVRLERVLAHASARIAPSLVRIETFGGTRKSLTGPTPQDGAAAPERRSKPRPERGSEPDEKPLGPLVMPGFLQAQGATTGVVLTSDGWILISRFAINFDPTTILVTLPDGRSFHASRGGEDTSRGIALVKIDATDLPVPEFVDPASVHIGQWAFALGRTFGESEPSVHMGIVSATRRLFGRAVQVDAYTSPANYGGAVIDVRGRVLGIAVPLSPSGRDVGVDWYDSGIGFATTIADIPEILDRLKSGEILHRAFLGIRFDPTDTGPGVLLDEVTRGSPAREAGLQKGDRIVELDGIVVRNHFHLQMLVSSKMAGDSLELLWNDGDGTRRATIELGAAPDSERSGRTKKEESFVPPWYDDEPADEGR
ncbi:MAG: trypsin-like peptidase domain-containing protein [Planctomycetes bacterium]|nr:trypsin-like peptidase domain-containing protein [Planctomycetota bacterium]